MTPEIFAGLSDWVILRCYFAPRDKRGRLATNGKRQGWRARRRRRLERAPSELPSPESLGVPEEVMNSRVMLLAPTWVTMYYQTWRTRGLSAEEVTQKFRDEGHLKGA